MSAWVPVAPVSTRDGRDFFPSLDIPTMILYGELDTGLGLSSSKDLQLIPTSTKPQVLPGAKHPAYLDQVIPVLTPDLTSQTNCLSLCISAPALAPAPPQLHLCTLSLTPVWPVTRVLCDV